MVEEMPSNSHKSKKAVAPEQKSDRPESLPAMELKGTAVQKKPSVFMKMRKSIFGNADAGEVGRFLLIDVILPTTRSLISDLIVQGTDRALYGDSTPPRRRTGYTNGGVKSNYVPYNKVASRHSNTTPPWETSRDLPRSSRASHNFDSILFEHRDDAEAVLERLDIHIERYDVATVSNFYDLLGIKSEFTDEKYGWNNLANAKIRRVPNGYTIDMPEPMMLD